MADARAVFDVTAKNFQADVVERSRQVPVVVLFWADQLPPAKDARRVLETLAGQYGGKFALALSDVSRDQSLAQSLRVQGLPSIRVIQDGQLIDQMEGPQGERALRAMLDRLTMTSGELMREQLDGRARRRRLRSRARDVAAGARRRAEQPGVQTRICGRADSQRRPRSGAHACSRRCRKAPKGAIVR